MSVTKLLDARRLVNYMNQNSDFDIIASNTCNYSNNIAALFTDVILQAGVNYKTVVAPRVSKILRSYPTCCTVTTFYDIVQNERLEDILSWRNEIKIRRIISLIDFCRINNIDTSCQLREFLLESENKIEFLNIQGIGKKTYDYLLKLLNVDTVAVDRHICSFLERAGVQSGNYDYAKAVVECAADLIGATRRSIDYSIWHFMAYEEKEASSQHILDLT